MQILAGVGAGAPPLVVDYLVVAGGAGGGGSAAANYGGGGGGAGGLRSTVTATGGGGSLETALTLATGTNYTVQMAALHMPILVLVVQQPLIKVVLVVQVLMGHHNEAVVVAVLIRLALLVR